VLHPTPKISFRDSNKKPPKQLIVRSTPSPKIVPSHRRRFHETDKPHLEPLPQRSDVKPVRVMATNFFYETFKRVFGGQKERKLIRLRRIPLIHYDARRV
jgi:hypothetical protein